MESIIDRSFSINFNILTALRIYRPKKAKSFNKVQAYFVYFIFIVLVPFLTLLYFIFGEKLDRTRINFNASFLVETFGFMTKLLPFITNEQQIRQCINHLGAPCFKAKSRDEEIIIDDCIRICKRNSTALVFLIVPAMLSWSLMPLFRKDHGLPLDIWLPFDATENAIVYVAVYLFLSTCIVLILYETEWLQLCFAGVAYAGFTGSLVDPLIGGLAHHAATQLMVLQYNLKNISRYVEAQMWLIGDIRENEEAKFEITYNKIKACIRHHEAILTFVEKYEECFSFVVFSQFAASAFVICFCCLQLYLMPLANINNTFLSITCICIALVQIYFYCYYGTILFEENNNVTNAAYMSSWYDFDIKSQKALVTLMERSKRPMIVTAGKILELSLDTFTTVLKRSYSLLAVMKNYT